MFNNSLNVSSVKMVKEKNVDISLLQCITRMCFQKRSWVIMMAVAMMLFPSYKVSPIVNFHTQISYYKQGFSCQYLFL